MSSHLQSQHFKILHSLTPLYDKVSEMTELLRAGTQTDYQTMVEEILALRDELKALCESD